MRSQCYRRLGLPILFLTLLLPEARATTGWQEKKEERKAAKEKRKLEKVRKQQLDNSEAYAFSRALTFYDGRVTIPTRFSDEAWGRANEWVTLCSGLRIDVSSERVLQTYRSSDSASLDLACTVNRSPSGPEETTVTALCAVNNMFGQGNSRRGTALLTRYILTGDPSCLNSGLKVVDAKECLIECDYEATECAPKPMGAAFSTTPSSVANGSCTVEQITAMVKAGLSDIQIKAACDAAG